MIGRLLGLLAVGLAFGASGGRDTKQVGVVKLPKPSQPPSSPSSPKPNVGGGGCPMNQTQYHQGGACEPRYFAPGWIKASHWIPKNKYGGQVGHPANLGVDGNYWVAVEFEYNEDFSDGEKAVLTAISVAYNMPEIWGTKPKDWSPETLTTVGAVLNHPDNKAQLGRTGVAEFKQSIKGWRLHGVSVAKRYSPLPMTRAEAQQQSSSHQDYPTIYMPEM
jgi:hypothetical protein